MREKVKRVVAMSRLFFTVSTILNVTMKSKKRKKKAQVSASHGRQW